MAARCVNSGPALLNIKPDCRSRLFLRRRRRFHGVEVAKQDCRDLRHLPVHLGTAMRPTFGFPQIISSFAHLTLEVPGVYRHSRSLVVPPSLDTRRRLQSSPAPARAGSCMAHIFRIPRPFVCGASGAAGLFHGAMVSMMMLIPPSALSISPCTRSTSAFRNC
jgi:hypothetical protein